ncbi:hypothetical protein K440DRAFT_658590, partial [Wilcoxina mikolae CBS 423.85]
MSTSGYLLCVNGHRAPCGCTGSGYNVGSSIGLHNDIQLQPHDQHTHSCVETIAYAGYGTIAVPHPPVRQRVHDVLSAFHSNPGMLHDLRHPEQSTGALEPGNYRLEPPTHGTFTPELQHEPIRNFDGALPLSAPSNHRGIRSPNRARRFFCSIDNCSTGFARKADLTRHQNSRIHKDATIRCKVSGCPRLFA